MRIVRFQSAFWSFRRRSFGLKEALMVSICRHAGKGEMRFFCSTDGAAFWRFPNLAGHWQYSKKGKRQWPMKFFRKGLRGALGWGMAVGAVSAHAARPFGDAEVWLLLLLRLIIRRLGWPKSVPDVFAEFALTRIKVCAREMKYFLS